MPVSLKEVKRKLLFDNDDNANLRGTPFLSEESPRQIQNGNKLISNGRKNNRSGLQLDLDDLLREEENDLASSRRHGGRYEALIERYKGELGGSLSARYEKNLEWKVGFDGSISAREQTQLSKLDPDRHLRFSNVRENSLHFSPNKKSVSTHIPPNKCIFKHETYANLCHDTHTFRDELNFKDLDKYCTKNVVSLNLNRKGEVKPVAVDENSQSVKRIIQMNKYRKSVQKTKSSKSRTAEWLQNNHDIDLVEASVSELDKSGSGTLSARTGDRKLVQTNVPDLYSSHEGLTPSVISKPEAIDLVGANVQKRTVPNSYSSCDYLPSSVITKTDSHTTEGRNVEKGKVKNLYSSCDNISLSEKRSDSRSSNSPVCPNCKLQRISDSPQQSNCDINFILDKPLRRSMFAPEIENNRTNGLGNREDAFCSSARAFKTRCAKCDYVISIDSERSSSSKSQENILSTDGESNELGKRAKLTRRRHISESSDEVEDMECDSNKENTQSDEIRATTVSKSHRSRSSSHRGKNTPNKSQSRQTKTSLSDNKIKKSSYMQDSKNGWKYSKNDYQHKEMCSVEVKKYMMDDFKDVDEQEPASTNNKKKARLSRYEVGNLSVCDDSTKTTAPTNNHSTVNDVHIHTHTNSISHKSEKSRIENKALTGKGLFTQLPKKSVNNQESIVKSQTKPSRSNTSSVDDRDSEIESKIISNCSQNSINSLNISAYQSGGKNGKMSCINTENNGVCAYECTGGFSYDKDDIPDCNVNSIKQKPNISHSVGTSVNERVSSGQRIGYPGGENMRLSNGCAPSNDKWSLSYNSDEIVSVLDNSLHHVSNQPSTIDEFHGFFQLQHTSDNNNIYNQNSIDNNNNIKELNSLHKVRPTGVINSSIHRVSSQNSSLSSNHNFGKQFDDSRVNKSDSSENLIWQHPSQDTWENCSEGIQEIPVSLVNSAVLNKPSGVENGTSSKYITNTSVISKQAAVSHSDDSVVCEDVSASLLHGNKYTATHQQDGCYQQSLNVVTPLVNAKRSKEQNGPKICSSNGVHEEFSERKNHQNSSSMNGVVLDAEEQKVKKQKIISDAVAQKYGKYSNIDACTMDAILQMDNGRLQLLRDMYCSDSHTQREILLQATYFKKWQKNADSSASLDNSLTSDEINNLQNVYAFNVLKRYFMRWKRRSRQATLLEKARLLHRHHMLLKGFVAFRWSVNSSKLREDILKQKFQSFQLSTTFLSWHRKTITRRYNRMQKFFICWKTRTDEVQRAQELQNHANSKILVQAFTLWKERFQTLLKEKKAVSHFRGVLLTYGWKMWQVYLYHALEKKKKQQQASSFYEKGVQMRVFHQFKVMYEKYKKSRYHHRDHLLKSVLKAWKEENFHLKEERLEVELFCDNHWKLSLQREFFSCWKENVWQNKAEKFVDKCVIRNAFQVWQRAWHKKKDHQHRLQEALRYGICKWVLLVWKTNVQEIQLRNANAVLCLERVLASQTLRKWHHITNMKINLRDALKHIREVKEKRQLKTFMDLWKTKIQYKLDISKADTYWSNKCARKAAMKWQKICHKRNLKRLLRESEPQRNKCLMQVMFQKWIEAHQRVKDEKVEAGEVCEILKQSKLQLYFNKWKHDTQQLLKIKPLIERKQHHLLHGILVCWHGLVRKKKQCTVSSGLVHKSKMRWCFNTWRRQYLIHQIEDNVAKKTLTGLMYSCFQGWSNFIKRKHASKNFHDKKLVKRVYTYWKSKCRRQIQDRTVELVVKERNLSIKKEYFDLWYENVHSRLSQAENAVRSFHQRQLYTKLTSAFNSWRRHLRVTLLSREFNRSSLISLQRRTLQQWHSVSQQSMHQAISQFSEQIGMEYQPDKDQPDSQCTTEQEYEASQSSDQSDVMPYDSARFNNGMDDIDVNYLHVLPNNSSGSQINSPRSSVMSFSSYGSPMRRLFSLDKQGSQERILSCEKAVDSLLQNNRNEEDIRKEKLKSIVVTVVSRLLHWPSSVVFDHWRDYALFQKELRSLAETVRENHKAVLLALKFKEWKSHYHAQQKAVNHRNIVLRRKVLHILTMYAVARKEKEEKKESADKHYALKLYRNMFPLWRDKAQDKHFKKKVVHLWSNVTVEELNLMPLEQSLQERFDRKSLQLCLNIWRYRYQQVMKMKSVYHNIIQHNCLQEWHHVCQLQKERRQKSIDFRNKTVLSTAFKTWCKRRHQKREVEHRRKNISNANLSVVLQEWHEWASASKARKLSAVKLVQNKDRSDLEKSFGIWKTELGKYQKAKEFNEKNVKIRMLSEWHEVAHWRKQLHDKMSEFRVKHLVKLVKISFQRWKTRYLHFLKKRADHEEFIAQKANAIARHWLKKARKSRSKGYADLLQNRMVKTFFTKWKDMYNKCLVREDVCDDVVVNKNKELVRRYMETWRAEYTGATLQKVYNHKLLFTVMVEWRQWIKGNKERVEKGAVVKRRQEDNYLRMFFIQWQTAYNVKKSVQHHHNSKLLISVFHAWQSLTHKRVELNRNRAFISHKINIRIARMAVDKMKKKFIYCQNLTMTLHLVEAEKNKATLTWALSTWYNKLQRIYAARYFRQLLAVRVVRRWREFIVRNKAQRMYEEDIWEFAEHHHSQKLCKQVLTNWFTEVLISRFIKVRHRRYAEKYARRWKLCVDMAHTAAVEYEENLFVRSFHKWRLEFIKLKAAKNVENNARKLLLTQVFCSWRKLTAEQKVLNTPVLSSAASTCSLEMNDSFISNVPVLSPAPSTSSLYSYVSSIPVLSPAPSVSSLCSNESSAFSRDGVHTRPRSQQGQKSRHSSSSSSSYRPKSNKSWKY